MRSLPILFNQQDYHEPLGNSPIATIATDGCYITAMAIVANYYGKQTDPHQLNQFLTQNNLYVQGDLVGGDDTLSKVYPDIKYNQTMHYEQVPADLKTLHSLLDDPTISVILQIDMGDHYHFVVCVGCNGTVTIVDPETGKIVNFADVYGDPTTKILKFVIYSGIPAVANQQATIYKGLNLNDTASMKVAVDVWDRVVNLHQFVDVAEYNNMQQEYNNVNDTNRKLTAENAELNGKVAQLNQDLADYHNKDKTAVEAGLANQEKLEQAEDALTKVGIHVNVEDKPYDSALHLADAIITKIEDGTKSILTQQPVQEQAVQETVQQSLSKKNSLFMVLFGWLLVPKQSTSQ